MNEGTGKVAAARGRETAILAMALTDDKSGTVAPHRVVPWAALHPIGADTARSPAGRVGPVPVTGPSIPSGDAEQRS